MLVGHGTAAPSAPREDVSRLRALEGARRARGGPMTDEERDLDARLRALPRSPEGDPYSRGLEAVAAAMRARVGRVVVAYNELAAPSLPDAIAQLAEEGVTRVTVVSSMVTPGGVHSERDIPEALEEARAAHPGVEIRYAWPFDPDAIAALLAARCASA